VKLEAKSDTTLAERCPVSDPLELVRDLLRLNAEAKKAKDAAMESAYDTTDSWIALNSSARAFAESERALGCGDLKAALPALCDELERLREFFDAYEYDRAVGKAFRDGTPMPPEAPKTGAVPKAYARLKAARAALLPKENDR